LDHPGLDGTQENLPPHLIQKLNFPSGAPALHGLEYISGKSLGPTPSQQARQYRSAPRE
jgi:hypothetical protein